MPNWQNKQTDDLCAAILALQSLSEARNFLRDLMTEKELMEFGKRWQAAQMLNKNVPYTEIQTKLGLSSTTIARIAKWLNNGMGGYKKSINKLNNHHRST
ncbi:MAG: YerC/YecD family TrpR-related protein [Candidatus Komeilibacteria bacterium]|nr:YerC/YecD family TrpR-related protein [Candidatus Komeilibacteria bacterium]